MDCDCFTYNTGFIFQKFHLFHHIMWILQFNENFPNYFQKLSSSLQKPDFWVFDRSPWSFLKRRKKIFKIVNKNTRLRSSGFRGTFNVNVSTGRVSLQTSFSCGLVLVYSIISSVWSGEKIMKLQSFKNSNFIDCHFLERFSIIRCYRNCCTMFLSSSIVLLSPSRNFG